MMKYFSDQNRTCFQYESGLYALTSGNRQWLGLVQEHSLEQNMNIMQIRYQGSTNRNVNDFADGNKEWNGTITYYPQDWKMLGFAIGSIQDLTGSHIFTETNNDDRVQPINNSLYSFTIEDSKNIGNAGSNFIRTTIGCMIDNWKLVATQGEIISCETNYIAQDSNLTSGTIVALAATTTKPYMFNNAQLHIPSGTLIDNATEITFSVNNNLDRDFHLNGSRIIDGLLPMNREYECTVNSVMTEPIAKTLYESYYIAGSTFNSMLKVWGSAGSLSIIMSGCKITDMSIPSPLEGVQEHSFTFIPTNVYPIAYDSISKYNAW